MNNFVIYIRVSTPRQGQSGLGLEAQLAKCTRYVESQKGTILKQFVDVESGKSRSRKNLLAAIEYCKEFKSTLVIATMDRLARDVEFTFRVVNSGIDIYFCDFPIVNTLILGVISAMAQYERELTSKRTKDALKAKKQRNEKVGGAIGLWGKNTKSDREVVMNSIRNKSAEIKRENAKNNANNTFFWVFMRRYINTNGLPTTMLEWEEVANQLNELNQKTATGMEYNSIRAAAMYRKLKRMFNK